MSGERKRKIYRRLVSTDEVLQKIEERFPLRPLGREKIYIGEAVGRVLAGNVYSKVNLPPYMRSLVDGYAVISSDLEGVYENRPKALKLVGKVSTGETVKPSIGEGECLEVSTGAVVPYPADAVVPVEYAERVGDKVVFYRSVRHGENIDIVGSDVVAGEVVAWRGEALTPLMVNALAASGIREVEVYRRVKVGIIPTGNELKKPGEELEYGQIYDSNSHMVYSILKSLGAEPKTYPKAGDDYEEIKSRVREALEENDIVVCIGGTSAGLEDYVYRVFSEFTPGILIHGVKQKPGRPLVVALSGKKLLFGLPGFPLSCFLSCLLYLAPVVSRLQGMRTYKLRLEKAKVAIPLRGQPGIRIYLPCILYQRNGEKYAYPLPGHSGRVGSVMMVDGFLIVPEDRELVEQGEELNIIRYFEAKNYSANIIGSHCPLLQHLIEKVSAEYSLRVVNVGSSAGLEAIKLGVADAAGTHLLDPETREYNVPIIKRLGLEEVIVVRGYLREQGFVYNRKLGKINSFSEIAEKGLRFVNRNPGSGTRVLTDQLIAQEAKRLNIAPEELKKSIRGYTFEAKTHEAVGYIVSQGLADVGVAVRYIAEKYGLAFTRIREERYDLVLRKDSLNKPAVQALFQQFTRDNLEKIVAEFPGYRLDCETGKKIEI